MWSIALAALAMGSLAMVGGTTIGGELGPLTAGYGLLVVLGALYTIFGLAVRDRIWRRFSREASSPGHRLAGHRVF